MRKQGRERGRGGGQGHQPDKNRQEPKTQQKTRQSAPPPKQKPPKKQQQKNGTTSCAAPINQNLPNQTHLEGRVGIAKKHNISPDCWVGVIEKGREQVNADGERRGDGELDGACRPELLKQTTITRHAFLDSPSVVGELKLLFLYHSARR